MDKKFLNTKVPINKSIEISLSSAYGIGRSRAVRICKKLGFNPKGSFDSLSNKYRKKIVSYVNFRYKYGYHLKRMKKQRITFLVKLQSYRGRRHFAGYLVRGQKTRNKKRIKERLKGNSKKKKRSK